MASVETSLPTTTAAPETTTTTAAPKTTTTAPPDATTTAAPATTQPEASERQFGWTHPFSLTVSPDWTRDESSTPAMFSLKAGSRWIILSTEGPETVDAWVESLTTNENLVAAEPEPVEIGSAPGFVLDVRLGEGAIETGCFGQGPCVVLLNDGGGWVIVDGSPNRVWVVDIDGDPVVILTEATEAGFENWTATVSEALARLEWTA